MTISLNHTIVAARDKQHSAYFLTVLFGLPDPVPAGHFLAVQLENGVTLDFAEPPPHVELSPQHYAFLVSEDDFDKIYGRILEQKLEHWADPRQSRTGSTETTADAEHTSSTRPVTTSKSSPGHTVRAGSRRGCMGGTAQSIRQRCGGSGRRGRG